MYLTDEKRLNLKLNGSFYTRKWNEFVDYIYFEKILGGKSLLKNISKKSQELNLSFNSSMISEVEAKFFSWIVIFVIYRMTQNFLQDLLLM